jgi:hypothetical protein
MTAFATNLIEALGGTTAVATLIDAPITTVQSWKSNGIPRSRLSHLKLIAERDGKCINWETGALVACDGGSADHTPTDNAAPQHASSGKPEEVSAPARTGVAA